MKNHNSAINVQLCFAHFFMFTNKIWYPKVMTSQRLRPPESNVIQGLLKPKVMKAITFRILQYCCAPLSLDIATHCGLQCHTGLQFFRAHRVGGAGRGWNPPLPPPHTHTHFQSSSVGSVFMFFCSDLCIVIYLLAKGLDFWVLNMSC